MVIDTTYTHYPQVIRIAILTAAESPVLAFLLYNDLIFFK